VMLSPQKWSIGTNLFYYYFCSVQMMSSHQVKSKLAAE